MGQRGLKTVMFIALMVMIFLLVISLYMMLKIVPEYSQSYRLLSQELPFITRVCLKISAVANKFSLITAGVLLAAILGSVIMGVIGKNKMFAVKVYTGVASLVSLFIVFCYFATRLPIIRIENAAEQQFAAEGFQMVPSQQGQ